jgi:methylmalonyl-CoA mutase cobalamin-binding subunit
VSEGDFVPRRARSLVVLANEGRSIGESGARALAESLGQVGIDAVFFGQQSNAAQIVSVAVAENVDTIELCLPERGGVRVLRELLRELDRTHRRQMSVVVHRVN